jgi:hypothetical protein
VVIARPQDREDNARASRKAGKKGGEKFGDDFEQWSLRLVRETEKTLGASNGRYGWLGSVKHWFRSPPDIIPVVDNLLDTLATPAAFVAGTIVSAAVMIDAPPMVKWTAAVIAGGGIAGLTQGMTGILRAHSTVLTGGLGNPIIATAELGGAALISLLALAAPTIAIALVVVFLIVALRLVRRRFRGARSSGGT